MPVSVDVVVDGLLAMKDVRNLSAALVVPYMIPSVADTAVVELSALQTSADVIAEVVLSSAVVAKSKMDFIFSFTFY